MIKDLDSGIKAILLSTRKQIKELSAGNTDN